MLETKEKWKSWIETQKSYLEIIDATFSENLFHIEYQHETFECDRETLYNTVPDCLKKCYTAEYYEKKDLNGALLFAFRYATTKEYKGIDFDIVLPLSVRTSATIDYNFDSTEIGGWSYSEHSLKKFSFYDEINQDKEKIKQHIAFYLENISPHRLTLLYKTKIAH
jgi:hypothetical protein